MHSQLTKMTSWNNESTLSTPTAATSINVTTFNLTTRNGTDSLFTSSDLSRISPSFIFLGVFSVTAGTVLNLICAISTYRLRSQAVVYYLICNHNIADSLLNATGIVKVVTMTHGLKLRIVCEIMLRLHVLIFLVSLSSIVIMSCDRMLKAVSVEKYKRYVTKHNVLVTIAVCWTTWGMFVLLEMNMYDWTNWHSDGNCGVSSITQMHPTFAKITVYSFSFLLIVFIALQCVTYSLALRCYAILSRAVHQGQTGYGAPNPIYWLELYGEEITHYSTAPQGRFVAVEEARLKIMGDIVRAARGLLMITVIHLILIGQIAVSLLLRTLGIDSPRAYILILKLFLVFNGIMNAILYLKFVPEILNESKRLMKEICCHRYRQVDTST